jgi:hypothetical protein
LGGKLRNCSIEMTMSGQTRKQELEVCGSVADEAAAHRCTAAKLDQLSR